jgi:hypothetical protein
MSQIRGAQYRIECIESDEAQRLLASTSASLALDSLVLPDEAEAGHAMTAATLSQFMSTRLVAAEREKVEVELQQIVTHARRWGGPEEEDDEGDEVDDEALLIEETLRELGELAKQADLKPLIRQLARAVKTLDECVANRRAPSSSSLPR